MSGSEKKVNRNTLSTKIGERICFFFRQMCIVTRTFHVMVVQNNGKEIYKKTVLHVQSCFFVAT